jgi:DNA helicase HerA-like ATPase
MIPSAPAFVSQARRQCEKCLDRLVEAVCAPMRNLLDVAPFNPRNGSSVTPLAEEAAFAALRLVRTDPSRIHTGIDLLSALGLISRMLETIHEPHEVSTCLELETVVSSEGVVTLLCTIGFASFGSSGTCSAEVDALATGAQVILSSSPFCWEVERIDPSCLTVPPHSHCWRISPRQVVVAAEDSSVVVPARFDRSPNSWLELVTALVALKFPVRMRTTLLAAELSVPESIAFAETTSSLQTLHERTLTKDPLAAYEISRAIITMGDLTRSYKSPLFVGEVMVTSPVAMPRSLLRLVAASITHGFDVGQRGAAPSVADKERLLGGYTLEPVDSDTRSALGAAWLALLPLRGGLIPREAQDLFSLHEALCAFQLPVPAGSVVPTLPSGTRRRMPAPRDLPRRGPRIGSDTAGRSVHLPIEPGQHVHIMGATGSGKSTVIDAVLRHNARASGQIGTVLIDPHGDLANRTIAALEVNRKPYVLIQPGGERSNSIALVDTNALTATSVEKPVSVIVDAITRLLPPEWAGPRFRRIARAALNATLLAGKGLSEVSALISDERSLRELAAVDSLSTNDRNTLLSLTSNANQDRVGNQDWVASKFDELSRTGLSQIFHQNGLVLADVINSHAIIVDLGQSGLSTSETSLVASILLDLIASELFTRPASKRIPVLVAVDEAQLLPAVTLRRFLDEGRKFLVSLTIAHQHLGQLSPMLSDAVQGAANTVVMLRQHARESRLMAERAGLLAQDLTSLPDLEALLLTRHGGVEAPTFTVDLDQYPVIDLSLRHEMQEPVLDEKVVSRAPDPEAPFFRRSARAHKPEVTSGWLDLLVNGRAD